MQAVSKTPVSQHSETELKLAIDFSGKLKISEEIEEKPPHGGYSKTPMMNGNIEVKPHHGGDSKTPISEHREGEGVVAEDFNLNLKISKEIEEKPPYGGYSKAPMNEHMEAKGKLAADFNTSLKIKEGKPAHGGESYIPPPEDEEFSFNCSRNIGPQVNAGDIFQNGRIRPFSSLLNRDLIRKTAETKSSSKTENIPVKNHDIRSRKNEELERPNCDWRGKALEVSRRECIQKCNSTGLSKVRIDGRKMVRSHSDGKDACRDRFQIPKSPLNPMREMETAKKMKMKRSKTISAHERHYIKNRERSEGDKRKSFLPYKRGIVGIFTKANRFSFSHPF